jgi:hypothetical protein
MTNFKGGIIYRRGYRLILTPNHPRVKNNSKKYVEEAVLVMEKHLKRYLTLQEIVHHINQKKDDNRIENLKLFKSNSEHTKFHRKNLPYKHSKEIKKKIVVNSLKMWRERRKKLSKKGIIVYTLQTHRKYMKEYQKKNRRKLKLYYRKYDLLRKTSNRSIRND